MANKVPLHQLAQVVAKLSLEKSTESTKELAKSVAAYLLEEHRISDLDSLMRDVQKFWAKLGYVDVIARVARPLPETVYHDLAEPFKVHYPLANKVNVTPVVDPAVIGGATMELAEQRLDISIARRLSRFKKVIKVKGI
jgi:F0F1-type ATP synthase delta subunit